MDASDPSILLLPKSTLSAFPGRNSFVMWTYPGQARYFYVALWHVDPALYKVWF